MLTKNDLLVLSELKTVVLLNIFVKTCFFPGFFDESKNLKEQHLFEIETFCNIIFAVTFDQFNASLLTKVLMSLKNRLFIIICLYIIHFSAN